MTIKQQELRFPSTWGGRRVGAGRPKGSRTSERMPHTLRPPVSRHRPHHITLRVTRETWNLRSQRCFEPIRRALAAVRERPAFRIVQFSVQHNHLHLLVEAEDRTRMTRGMRALLVRIARGLNRVMGTRGARFSDRYHEHVLKTPNEALNALRYVVGNRDVHLRRWKRDEGVGIDNDPYSSAVERALVTPAGSWLLRDGWTRAGPL